METSHLLDVEFKRLIIMMLNELSENFNSVEKGMETIKKNHSEMKDTLIKITVYKESTVKWMKLRIKSVIWNIRKKTKPNQKSKKKKESKKIRIV